MPTVARQTTDATLSAPPALRRTGKVRRLRRTVLAADRGLAQGCHAGFTLIELVIVVMILGILATVAVPAAFNKIEDSQLQALQADLAAFAEAEQRHFAEKGRWPPNTYARNAAASTLSDYLPRQVFTKRPPGVTENNWRYKYRYYNLPWEWNGARRFVYVANDSSPSLWANLDRQYDDGVADSGGIRVLYTGRVLMYKLD